MFSSSAVFPLESSVFLRLAGAVMPLGQVQPEHLLDDVEQLHSQFTLNVFFTQGKTRKLFFNCFSFKILLKLQNINSNIDVFFVCSFICVSSLLICNLPWRLSLIHKHCYFSVYFRWLASAFYSCDALFKNTSQDVLYLGIYILKNKVARMDSLNLVPFRTLQWMVLFVHLFWYTFFGTLFGTAFLCF